MTNSNGLHQLLIRTIGRTAELVQAYAEEHDLARINERDHLQKQFNLVLAELAADWPGAPNVNTRCAISLPDDFHRIGRADNSIVWNDELPVLIELKAGDTLAACAWDAVKLVAALRAGQASAAVLVAAAPAALWPSIHAPSDTTQALPGAELLASATHRAADLRERYASSWRRWDLDGRRDDGLPGYVPIRAAAEFETEYLWGAPFQTATGVPWEIRAARVRDGRDANAWFAWPTAEDLSIEP